MKNLDQLQTLEYTHLCIKIKQSNIDEADKVQEYALECSKLSGLVHIHGWNDYYHRWDICLAASNPLRGYLKHLVCLTKSYPDGNIRRWVKTFRGRSAWSSKFTP